jgi:hypothetical protein
VRIRKTGERSWRFEGTALTMQLITDKLLQVGLTDNDGAEFTYHFVNLPTTIDDLIAQEKHREESAYRTIYTAGPLFSSEEFGRLTLDESGDFMWDNFDLLVPDYIPPTVLHRGHVEMKLNLDSALERFYNGVVTFRFMAMGGPDRNVSFLYMIYTDDSTTLLRLEYVPPANIKDAIVTKQEGGQPVVVDFYKSY